MSIYELYDYDRLLGRIGIPIEHDEPTGPSRAVWYCGSDPGLSYTYDMAGDGMTYDDIYTDPNTERFDSAYNGRAPRMGGNLCLTDDINVNGLLLNHRDRYGTVWLCTEIEGWWTLPPSEIADVPKPYWDGSLLTTGRYLARPVTVSGCFIPPDRSWVPYCRDLILRSASIVRGVGLLATCGSGPPSVELEGVFSDGSKMAIVQMADVPLVATTRPSGFTEFSLSFRSVEAIKQSVYEHAQQVPMSEEFRAYSSFANTTPVTPGDPPAPGDTTYAELRHRPDSTEERRYTSVKTYNPHSPIIDEDFVSAAPSGAEQDALRLLNQGNYFAFPIYVFRDLHIDDGEWVQIANSATGETMRLQNSIPADRELVVDTRARRVALVDPTQEPTEWTWNDRDFLTLDSGWVTLAPGLNQFVIDLSSTDTSKVKVNALPIAYWRDTWIG